METAVGGRGAGSKLPANALQANEDKNNTLIVNHNADCRLIDLS